MKIQKKKVISLLLIGFVVLTLVSCRGKSQDIAEELPPHQEEESLQQQPKDKEGSGNLQEESFEKNSLKGILEEEGEKPAILSFWVSWNEESKEQLAILENVYKLLQEDVTFIGVHATSFDTIPEEEVKDYLEEQGYSYPMLFDETGETSQTYYVGNLPTIVFLNHKKEVEKSFTTKIEEDQILDEIEIILEELRQ